MRALPSTGSVRSCFFFILGLERYGFRPLEVVISLLLGVVALSYLVETLLSHHNWGEIARAVLVPRFAGSESVLLAAGILGATVMPHVIFLHSALTQGRIVVRDPAKSKRLLALNSSMWVWPCVWRGP